MSEMTIQKLFQPDRESTLWAAANLDGIPSRFRFSQTTKVKNYELDGAHYRHAFNIVVAPERKTPHFMVWLFKGVTAADKAAAAQIIKLAQQGFFSTQQWRLIPATDDVPYARYVFDLSCKFDPKRQSQELRACLTEECINEMHGWMRDMQDDPCRTEGIEHPDGHYVVRGWKYYGEEWTADVTHDVDCFPEGPAGLKVIRDLANDFTWVQAECDRLNAKEPANV